MLPAPTEFMSLFSRQIRTNERWNTKNFDREKCWEASLHRYFSRSKGIAGICSFPPLIIPLPKKKGFPVGTGLHTRKGRQKGGKGRKGIDNIYRLTHKG